MIEFAVGIGMDSAKAIKNFKSEVGLFHSLNILPLTSRTPIFSLRSIGPDDPLVIHGEDRSRTTFVHVNENGFLPLKDNVEFHYVTRKAHPGVDDTLVSPEL